MSGPTQGRTARYEPGELRKMSERTIHLGRFNALPGGENFGRVSMYPPTYDETITHARILARREKSASTTASAPTKENDDG